MRPGAGRPSTGRVRRNYYVTPEEDAEIKKLIEQMRGHGGKNGGKQ